MIINRIDDMKKTIFIVGTMLCCLSVIAQTKFSGVIVNQSFSAFSEKMSNKFELITHDSPVLPIGQKYLVNKYKLSFLGYENTELVVEKNYEKDEVKLVRIIPPLHCYYWDNIDKSCVDYYNANAIVILSVYTKKFGEAQSDVEIKKMTEGEYLYNYYKWDRGDVIINLTMITGLSKSPDFWADITLFRDLYIEYVVKQNHEKVDIQDI